MKKEEFRQWLKDKKKDSTTSTYVSSINKISRHYSEQNHENMDLFDIDDILRIRNIANNFENDESYKNLDEKAHGSPRAAIFKYIEFLENKKAIIKNNGSKEPELSNNENTAYIKKPLSESSYETTQRAEQSHNIFDRAMKRIKEINRKSKNHNEGSIFNPSVYVYVEEIEESFKSFSQFKNLTEYLYRIIFKDFILNLYIIIYETTREKNFNRKPPYDYKLPDKFLINGTPTKDFLDIVGTLRHHYAHLEPEYKDKVSINKKPYGDVLKKLLESRDEPKSRGDFQRLQIEVLKLFEKAMESLLEMLKDD